MGNFRSSSRGGFGGRSRGRSGTRDSGGRSGGRSRFGDRDSRRSERRPVEMHDVTCDKCGKQCQVPFRPSGDKPVLCSDCFRNRDGNFDSSSGSGRGFSSGVGGAGASLEQFNQINEKLDKIILILKDLELEVDEDDDDLEDDKESEDEEEDLEED
jgi:CxxC-x17-CxxC domain-containing protein